jgi:hypothetical protein
LVSSITGFICRPVRKGLPQINLIVLHPTPSNTPYQQGAPEVKVLREILIPRTKENAPELN